MTLGEQLELAIYRFVESVGKGQGRSVDIGTVTNLIQGATNVDSVDALIRLHDDGYVTLVKYDARIDPVSYDDTSRDNRAFFYHGSFKVSVTPRGRLSFEQRTVILPPQQQPAETKGRRRFQTALNVYEDQGFLGEGGSGTVHRVSDADNNCYALKLLRKELLGGKRQRRFQHELNFCMKAAHPNVVQVIDHGLFGSEGCPFFVMPMYESTLRKAMKQGIKHDRIPHVIRQIVNALEFAHGRDIFHRDLKPENILCSADLNSVALADFGIAHFGEDILLSEFETGNQERLANFAYAAPEQRVSGSVVGAPADIWALGLIINELFTEELILGKGHRLIASVAPDYAMLDALIETMLLQSSEKRPAIGAVRPHFVLSPGGATNTEKDATNLAKSVVVDELRSSSPANLWLRIEGHPTSPGLVFDVTNRRTNNIRSCKVYLIDARSFDAFSGEYRDSFGLKKLRLGGHNEILAGDITTPSWLLRVENGHLEVGDTAGQGILLWPKGDPSEIQRWALTFLVEASDIEPWTLEITVEWQRVDNRLKLSQNGSTGASAQ